MSSDTDLLPHYEGECSVKEKIVGPKSARYYHFLFMTKGFSIKEPDQLFA
jgi:hypothetical protein